MEEEHKSPTVNLNRANEINDFYQSTFSQEDK